MTYVEIFILALYKDSPVFTYCNSVSVYLTWFVLKQTVTFIGCNILKDI